MTRTLRLVLMHLYLWKPFLVMLQEWLFEQKLRIQSQMEVVHILALAPLSLDFAHDFSFTACRHINIMHRLLIVDSKEPSGSLGLPLALHLINDEG